MNVDDEPLFLLGRFAFRIASRDPQLKNTVQSLLPSLAMMRGCKPQFETVARIDLDVPVEIDGRKVDLGDVPMAIGYILEQALASHKGVVWLEGSTMIDERGRVHVLGGSSFSGKTTLSLALALSVGWKIVSEDISFIDLAQQSILSYARPLGIREGTAQRIQLATGRAPGGLTIDAWHFDPSVYHLCPVPIKMLDTASLLSRINPLQSEHLTSQQVSGATWLRKMCSVSNVLRMPSSIAPLDEILQAAACFDVRGGNLDERLHWLMSVANARQRSN